MNYFDSFFNFDNGTSFSGFTYELDTLYILRKYETGNDNVVVLTSSLYEANKMYENLKTYTDDVFLFPMDDFLTSMILAVSPELQIKRLETLENIKNNKKSIIITNLMGFLRFLPDIKTKDKLSFKIKKNQKINREKLEAVLNEFGYNRDSLVTSTGEYAVRGFIIDIFLIAENHPIRIEFFDDEVESIRFFDETSQLSINEIDSINFLPYKEVETRNASSLFEYMNNPTVIYIDYDQIKASYIKLAEEMVEYAEKNDANISDLMFELNKIDIKKEIFVNTFADNNVKYNYNSKEIVNFESNFEKLEMFINGKIKAGKTVIFFLSKEKQIEKIKEKFFTNLKGIKDNSVNIVNKKINRGFEIDKFVVISEYDIENINNKSVSYKNSYRIGRKIKGFADIKAGDYVVHTVHGIGVYKGVITLTKDGVKKDYIQIDYQGNDKVYIPVEKIDTIYKYADKEGNVPKINKLGTTAWAKTKLALKKKIKDISGMLIKLYAERSQKKSFEFGDFPEEDLFALEFPYTPTDDQVKAISEINQDLKSVIPMDRLLCGDVGFGKTEVAFRAIFKTIMNNHQVLYLCPTTILSNQQYQNAIERFKNYPINIALLNRYTTKKETTKILRDLSEGKIDMVFGTHRLLSEDIKPKQLGLLVVDEEQRFGVTHKEKIKKYKNDVNVLTLSATPIPRTLKMAMSGLRDLSIIDTAPAERYPVQTYVLQENELLIKDSIYKELSRGGQVFILYNRVETIERQVERIKHLVPDARILFAHGQMSKTELENVMQKFVNFEADILICTTIIETGIDIANVNTLIIYEADRFGLSQLYQLRGRVGRSNKIAYAYLMYNPHKILNEIAMKRLNAIKEFTELGSGYKVAMRDLSIRGAGDILGSEQAGFVSNVGIDLYMKMIDEEIKHQRGEDIPDEDDTNTSLINVETHISDDYVSEEDLIYLSENADLKSFLLSAFNKPLAITYTHLDKNRDLILMLIQNRIVSHQNR